MKIIDFFKSENPTLWQAQLARCDWSAGAYLHTLLQEGRLASLVGDGVQLLLLTEGDELISFCTLAARDDIPATSLSPWIGWVYTFPRHRGHRYVGRLLSHAEALAKKDGADAVYISTDTEGLYEKYGYTFLCVMQDVAGEDSRVYEKRL